MRRSSPPPPRPASLKAMGLGSSARAVTLAALGALGCGASLADAQRAAARCDIGALRSWLDADRSWLRREAAVGLGRCRGRSARAALESRALDPAEKRWVRAAAAEALGAFGDPGVVPVLIGLAADPGLEPEIKIGIIAALERFAEVEGVCGALAPMAARDDILVVARARLAHDRCKAEAE